MEIGNLEGFQLIFNRFLLFSTCGWFYLDFINISAIFQPFIMPNFKYLRLKFILESIQELKLQSSNKQSKRMTQTAKETLRIKMNKSSTDKMSSTWY